MAVRGKSARAQVPLRIPESLRARIATVAKDAGRSMNAEILERLERSFEHEDRRGGPGLNELIETIASVMKSTGQTAGFFEAKRLTNYGEWLALPYAFDQAVKAAVAILDHHRPPGEIVVPTPNLVQSVGISDLEETAQVRQMFIDLGQMMAARAIEDEENDDE